MIAKAKARWFVVMAMVLCASIVLAQSLHASGTRNGTPLKPATLTGSKPGEVLWTYYETTLAPNSCTTPGTPGCDTGGNGDNILRLVNPNGNANPVFGFIANECAMIYVFDDAQEMEACCGCPLSPTDLEDFSIEHDLAANLLIGGNPAAGKIGAIAVVAADSNVDYVTSGSSNGHSCASSQSAACNGGCDPTENPGYAPGSNNLIGAITHNQIVETGKDSIAALTEVPLFDDGAGDPDNLSYLQNECGVLVGGGSGAGVCRCPEIPPPPTAPTATRTATPTATPTPVCMGPAPGGPTTSSSDAGGTTSQSINTPASTQLGNFLLTIVALQTAPGHLDASSASITPPGGWTPRSFTTAGTDLAVGIFTKLAVSGDVGGAGSYTWSFNDTYRASIEMANYGTISGIPAGFGPTCVASTASKNITAPSLTTVPPNAVDVAIWVSASPQIPVPPKAYNTSCFQAGIGAGGGDTGPLPAISTLIIPGSGTMTGDQVATIGLPADNVGCQINLSP